MILTDENESTIVFHDVDSDGDVFIELEGTYYSNNLYYNLNQEQIKQLIEHLQKQLL